MDPQDLFNNINAKLAANDIEGAIDLAEVAVALGHQHPTLFNLCAHRLEQRGEYQAALDLLHQALQLDPNDASILSAIGHCWLKQGQPDRALPAFNDAVRLDPRFAPAHHGIGLAFAWQGDLAQAQMAQERAAALDPNYPDPLGALSIFALNNRERDKARAYAEAALRLAPAEPSALITLARLDVLEERYDDTTTRLSAAFAADAIPPLQKSPLLRLMGDALDGLGRYDEAFAAYRDCNLLLKTVYEPVLGGDTSEDVADTWTRVHGAFDRLLPTGGFDATTPVDGPNVNHVFLVGFPRSGTTLLEQVLASHPDILALEEKPILHKQINEYFADAASLERLIQLSDAETAELARAYWRRVAEFGIHPEGKTFVDKQPALTLYLPLMLKLFPKAKVIFAVRDPRDVLLSCFRRGFNMNATIFQFTTLERLAVYYSNVMKAYEFYADRMAFQAFTYKHEDTVADFDGEIRRLCAFLGVAFDDNMRNFVETAKQRDVRTPSAPQVVKGLNTSGVGYWRNYERHLEPILPALQPWVERFGYA